MRVLAQSMHRPSRVHPSLLDQQEDGSRSPNVNRMQRLSRVPPLRAMLEVAGSASTEGRRPTRMLEVTVSSPEDRSTTVVRSTVPSRHC